MMTDAAKRGGARAGAGRKPKPAAEVLRVSSIRLTAAHWVEFRSLGGVTWLRKKLGRARVAP